MKNIKKLVPPTAKKIVKKLSVHGDTRLDPYYWLNDRSNPDVIKYLEDENAYTKQELKQTETLQEELFAEIVGRIKQTDMSVPYRYEGYFYRTKFEEGQEHPIYVRSKDEEGASEVTMLNANELAKGQNYYRIGGRSVSPNNHMVAFGEDILSRRIYSIRIKDLTSGKFLPDVIANTTGSAVWANDNKTLYYTRKDETLRAYKIFRHTLGTSPDQDVELYHEEDETFHTYVYKTKSRQYIIIASFATLSTEYRFLDANDPLGAFQIFLPREKKHEYFISHFEDRFYVRTNWKAQNFRLMVAPQTCRIKDDWQEVIGHRDDVLLEDIDIFKDFLVLSERCKGNTQLRVIERGGEDHHITFEETAFSVGTGTNLQFETDVLRFNFTSLKTPATTFDYNMRSRARTLLKQEEVVGEFDPANYRSKRLMGVSRDGTLVPISLVYHKDYVKSEESHLLLYGYGSYGISIDPNFRSSRLSLLDRGVAFAIAHIRGGEEMGRRWYESGKFLEKKNTFNDFIDCALFLQKEGYCSPSTTFAMGGSAGGLLMGAVVNDAPHLFKGVIAAVPFVDVVTTMLDESIPLTTGEYDEWGNPNDPKYYYYMKSYSPYDNVVTQSYPALLVTTGLHDSQVQYWEPAKWVAKLRDLKTDKRPLLLHCNMETGHGGAAGRFKRHRETALEYAFLLDLMAT